MFNDFLRLFKNPLTIWLKWLLLKSLLELRNRRNRLTIGYLAFLKECKFGYCNSVYEHST